MKSSTAGMAVALLLAVTSAHAGNAREHDGRGNDKDPVGSWEGQLIPRDCASGETYPEFANNYLFSFHEGGTMNEMSAQVLFQPGQRSTGFGVWERSGRGKFAWTSKAFILYTSVVTPPEVPRYVRGSMQLDMDMALFGGDRLEGGGPVTFMDTTGQVLGAGCAKLVATRLR